MILYRSILSILILTTISSCKEKTVPFQLNNCKGNPPFVRSVASFDPARSFFSTSEIRKMGLVLIENKGTASAPNLRYYQHPSWQKGGWLAPIVLDESGNIFTSPAPFINTLNNPQYDQNVIYKVDRFTGEMQEFIRLPMSDSITSNNAYGIIGMVYLCEAGVLYVSTVSGSDRFVERGGIYAIDVKKRKHVDAILGMDVMGMGISYVTGQRRLYFGSGRNSKIYSIQLSEKGRFIGKPEEAFSLEELGPRGDDKVRRIIADQNGNLQVHGIEFNFNLIAPREKQETVYNFKFDISQGKWTFFPQNQ